MKTDEMRKLFDLPESELVTGSELSKLVSKAGYTESVATLIGLWNCWDSTVWEFRELLAETTQTPKGRWD